MNATARWKLHILYISAIAAALLIGKYVLQEKLQVKETVRTVYVEKIVEKRAVKTHTVQTKKVDGTVITVTDIDDKTEIDTAKSGTVETKRETKGKAALTLGLLAIKDVANFQQSTNYGLTVTAPLFGNLKVQALGTTDKRVGLGLALEF